MLHDVEPEFHEVCITAWQFLEMVAGASNLGLAMPAMTDFTAREFELMNYLQSQLRKMKGKG